MQVLLEVPGLGTAATCVISPVSAHRPVPLRFVFHHVQPQEAGGQTVAGNLIQICDSCFTYGTAVSGHVERASRRWYSGELTEVRLSDGRELAGTPNHPVLTAYGWLPLGAIQQGYDLVAHHRDMKPVVRVGDVNRVPAVIGKVFDALPVSARIGVPGARVNLHGEWPRGNIDVVSTDSQLRYDLDRAAAEFSGDGAFPAAYAEADLLAGQRYADYLILAALASSAGHVSGGSVSGSLGGGHPAHPESVGGGAATAGHAVAVQERVDSVSADTGTLGDTVLGFPGDVSLYKVAGVRRFPFTGHVFNLQTVTGLYAANGIVVHNCHYSIHRLMWCLRLQHDSIPLTPVQAGNMASPNRNQLKYATQGFDACVTAGTVDRIPNEG
jgi:hypothetical protein